MKSAIASHQNSPHSRPASRHPSTPQTSDRSLKTQLLSTQTLVIIDPGIEDHETLAGGVVEGVSVLVLDSEQDGVHQITAAIQASNVKIQDLHLLCHGSPGTLHLGHTELSLKNLDYYSWEIQSWPELSSPSSLLLYACHLADGAIGQEFLQKLHRLTGANIAATSTQIGSAAKGGNWQLNVTLGKVNAALPFSPQALQSFTGILEGL